MKNIKSNNNSKVSHKRPRSRVRSHRHRNETSLVVPRLSIAPMVDVTHVYFRLLNRCVSKNTTLYTPMIVDRQILNSAPYSRVDVGVTHPDENAQYKRNMKRVYQHQRYLKRLQQYSLSKMKHMKSTKQDATPPNSFQFNSSPSSSSSEPYSAVLSHIEYDRSIDATKDTLSQLLPPPPPPLGPIYPSLRPVHQSISGHGGLIAQISGVDPFDLSATSIMLQSQGIDGININMGCPAESAQSGVHGAVMMITPKVKHQLEILRSNNRIIVPISIKCRLGVNMDVNYEWYKTWLMDCITSTGISHYIIHSRVAMLRFDAKKNRTAPPLQPQYIHWLQNDINEYIQYEKRTLEYVIEQYYHTLAKYQQSLDDYKKASSSSSKVKQLSLPPPPPEKPFGITGVGKNACMYYYSHAPGAQERIRPLVPCSDSPINTSNSTRNEIKASSTVILESLQLNKRYVPLGIYFEYNGGVRSMSETVNHPWSIGDIGGYIQREYGDYITQSSTQNDYRWLNTLKYNTNTTIIPTSTTTTTTTTTSGSSGSSSATSSSSSAISSLPTPLLSQTLPPPLLPGTMAGRADMADIMYPYYYDALVNAMAIASAGQKFPVSLLPSPQSYSKQTAAAAVTSSSSSASTSTSSVSTSTSSLLDTTTPQHTSHSIETVDDVDDVMDSDNDDDSHHTTPSHHLHDTTNIVESELFNFLTNKHVSQTIINDIASTIQNNNNTLDNLTSSSSSLLTVTNKQHILPYLQNDHLYMTLQTYINADSIIHDSGIYINRLTGEWHGSDSIDDSNNSKSNNNNNNSITHDILMSDCSDNSTTTTNNTKKPKLIKDMTPDERIDAIHGNPFVRPIKEYLGFTNDTDNNNDNTITSSSSTSYDSHTDISRADVLFHYLDQVSQLVLNPTQTLSKHLGYESDSITSDRHLKSSVDDNNDTTPSSSYQSSSTLFDPSPTVMATDENASYNLAKEALILPFDQIAQTVTMHSFLAPEHSLARQNPRTSDHTIDDDTTISNNTDGNNNNNDNNTTTMNNRQPHHNKPPHIFAETIIKLTATRQLHQLCILYDSITSFQSSCQRYMTVTPEPEPHHDDTKQQPNKQQNKKGKNNKVIPPPTIDELYQQLSNIIQHIDIIFNDTKMESASSSSSHSQQQQQQHLHHQDRHQSNKYKFEELYITNNHRDILSKIPFILDDSSTATTPPTTTTTIDDAATSTTPPIDDKVSLLLSLYPQYSQLPVWIQNWTDYHSLLYLRKTYNDIYTYKDQLSNLLSQIEQYTTPTTTTTTTTTTETPQIPQSIVPILDQINQLFIPHNSILHHTPIKTSVIESKSNAFISKLSRLAQTQAISSIFSGYLFSTVDMFLQPLYSLFAGTPGKDQWNRIVRYAAHIARGSADEIMHTSLFWTHNNIFDAGITDYNTFRSQHRKSLELIKENIASGKISSDVMSTFYYSGTPGDRSIKTTNHRTVKQWNIKYPIEKYLIHLNDMSLYPEYAVNSIIDTRNNNNMNDSNDAMVIASSPLSSSPLSSSLLSLPSPSPTVKTVTPHIDTNNTTTTLKRSPSSSTSSPLHISRDQPVPVVNIDQFKSHLEKKYNIYKENVNNAADAYITLNKQAIESYLNDTYHTRDIEQERAIETHHEKTRWATETVKQLEEEYKNNPNNDSIKKQLDNAYNSPYLDPVYMLKRYNILYTTPRYVDRNFITQFPYDFNLLDDKYKNILFKWVNADPVLYNNSLFKYVGCKYIESTTTTSTSGSQSSSGVSSDISSTSESSTTTTAKKQYIPHHYTYIDVELDNYLQRNSITNSSWIAVVNSLHHVRTQQQQQRKQQKSTNMDDSTNTTTTDTSTTDSTTNTNAEWYHDKQYILQFMDQTISPDVHAMLCEAIPVFSQLCQETPQIIEQQDHPYKIIMKHRISILQAIMYIRSHCQLIDSITIDKAYYQLDPCDFDMYKRSVGLTTELFHEPILNRTVKETLYNQANTIIKSIHQCRE